MKNLVNISFLFFTALLIVTSAFGQNVLVNPGNGSYATLKAAFDAINAGTHTGVITISIVGNTTETASASLNASGSGSANYTSITISPSGGAARTISGSLNGNLINFNGADNVTIDGLNTGGNSLTITNTNTGTSATTIRFIADATNNIIRNTTIRGSGTSTSLGVITFSTGTTTGNDNNQILNCNIDGMGSASTCIYSSGTTTSTTIQNSGIVVDNCNIYDFFNSSTASPVGVNLYVGNTNWTITNNSIYQTTNRSTALQGVHCFLQIYPYYTTDYHIVTGNFIGGNSPGANGSLSYTGTSTNAVGFIGLNVQTGGISGGNIVKNNIIRNVTVTYSASAGSFSNAGIFAFIGGFDGITTIDSNIVANISVTNNNGFANLQGIHVNGRVVTSGTTVKPTFNISNNTINNLTCNGTGAAQWYGIRLETSSANNLTTTTTICNPLFNVYNNNITNLSTTTIVVNLSFIRAIGSVNTNGTSSTCPLWPRAVISNNNINNITCNSLLGSYAVNNVSGIQFAGSGNYVNTTDTIYVTNNTIYNLISPNTSDSASSVVGIIGTNGIYNISRNKIYGLSNSSIGNLRVPMIAGINIRASLGNTGVASQISNNYIALGSGVTANTAIFGILNNFNASNPINVYYNSVYISGNSTTGTNNTSCLHRGDELFSSGTLVTTVMDVKNNLLINQRTGGGAGGHFAISSYSTGNWTSNYNALISSSAVKVGYWNATPQTFSNWKTNSGGDLNSYFLVTGGTTDFTINPSVLNPNDLFNDSDPSTTGILDIKTSHQASWIVNGRGYPISGIANDFGATGVRSTSTSLGPTDIGADEFTTSTTPPAAIASAAPAPSTTTTYTFAGKQLGSIDWGSSGTPPSSVTFIYYPGVSPSGNPVGNNIKSSWIINATGGSGYSYNLTLAYSPGEIGTILETNLSIGQKIGSAWYHQGGVVNTTNKTVFAVGLTSFSEFTLTDATNPLPIQLAFFVAQTTTSGVKLEWQTISEINNYGFYIERKKENEKDFTLLPNSFIPGNGTTVEPKDYSYIDNTITEIGTYEYRLKQVDNNGLIFYSNPIIVNIITLDVPEIAPLEFRVHQNYPNPFNPSTTIKFSVEKSEHVLVIVYNALGQQVEKLFDGIAEPGRYYKIHFNGSGLSSGIYYYRVVTSNKSDMKKMLLVK